MRYYIKHVVSALLLYTLFAGSLSSALAEQNRQSPAPFPLTTSEQKWLKAHPVIRLGIDPSYGPYSFVNDKGKPSGVVIDLLPLIEARLGIHIKVVSNLDWLGLMNALRHKRIDAVATVVDLPARRAFINFTKIYIPTPQVITTRKDTPQLKTIYALKKLTVALVRGYSSSKQVVQKFPELKVLYVKSPLDGLREVSDGDADAYVGVLGVNTFLATSNGLGNLKVNAAFDMVKNGQRFGVRKDWPILATLLNKALSAIPKHKMNQIFERWLPVQEGEIRRLSQPSFLVRLAPWLLGIIGIIIIAYLLQLLWNRQLKRELMRRKGELEKAQSVAHMGDWSMDPISGLIEWSDELFHIAGRPPITLDWPTLRSWLHPEVRDQHDQYFSNLSKFPSGKSIPPLISHLLRPDGSSRWLEVNCAIEYGDGDRPLRFYGMARDITERKRSEQQIELLAYYDPLTGLANRALLLDRLNQAIAVSRRTRQYGAIMFIDLDQFKKVNDVYGHDFGDKVLKEVSNAIRQHIRDGDTVARFGGDEFLILLPELSDNKKEAVSIAVTISEHLRIVLEEPELIEGQSYSATASIGIALFPQQNETVDDLIRNADIAMYRAKEHGRNTFVFFEDDMQAAIVERFSLEQDLREDIKQGGLQLYLQSKVNQAGTIVGAESLVRWKHSTRGLVMPVSFIPLAEETGLIVQIGDWVLRETCQLIARLNAMGHSLQLAVNVSPRQFHQTDFVARVRHILAETGADPLYLTLEITENLLVERTGDVISRMLELSELGIRFSIDDFGTGYSSLAYLKRLPLNELKIDKSFVQDIPNDANDVALVETILSMAHHLGFEVVAEGVETTAQFNFLVDRQCEHFQGYLFHRPQHMPDWLTQLEDRKQNSRPG